MPRKYVKTGLVVKRSKAKKGEPRKERFKTHLGNRGNDAFRELVRQERLWKQEQLA